MRLYIVDGIMASFRRIFSWGGKFESAGNVESEVWGWVRELL